MSTYAEPGVVLVTLYASDLECLVDNLWRRFGRRDLEIVHLQGPSDGLKGLHSVGPAVTLVEFHRERHPVVSQCLKLRRNIRELHCCWRDLAGRLACSGPNAFASPGNCVGRDAPPEGRP